MTSTLARRVETATGVALSVAVLGAIGLRLWNAGALWRDECAVVQLARVSTLGIAKDFTHEAFPPPFFFLVRLWLTLFGTSDAALRSYGFFVGAGLVAALWLVFRLARLGIPLISLGGIALSSSFLVWGTSVRGYGIGTVVALITLAGFTALLRTGSRSAAIIAFAAAVLSVQFLVQNTMLVLAISGSAFAVCLIVREWPRAGWIAGIVVLSELTFVLYIPSYLRAGEWSVVVESAASKRPVLQQLGAFFGINSSVWQWAICLCLLGVVSLAVRQIHAHRHEKNSLEFKLSLFALLAGVTSIVASVSFFRALHYTIQPWYLLAPCALGLTAVDLMVAMICHSPLLRPIRFGAAILLVAIVGWINRHQLVERQTNVDLIAQTLMQTADPADLIVVNPFQLGIPMQWYYHGGTAWVTLPQIDDHRIHRYDLLKEKMGSQYPVADVLQLAANTLRSGHNVWLVGGAKFSPAGEVIGPLPPAPHSKYGWDNKAYGRSWNEELGQFIELHTTAGRRIPIATDQPVNAVENVSLIVAQGWKD